MFKELKYLFLTLILSFTFVLVGCNAPPPQAEIASNGGNTTSNVSDNQQLESQTVLFGDDFESCALNSTIMQNYIVSKVTSDLQTEYGYTVESVASVYYSAEYVEDLSYNSQKNNYFGYDYEQIVSRMQNVNWCFTEENGRTVVMQVAQTNNVLIPLLKGVAIGSGVVLICTVVSGLAVGVGAPVVCFLAITAKQALKGALVGGAIGGAIGGIVGGVQTGTFDGALDKALSWAGDGLIVGAIGGTIATFI